MGRVGVVEGARDRRPAHRATAWLGATRALLGAALALLAAACATDGVTLSGGIATPPDPPAEHADRTRLAFASVAGGVARDAKAPVAKPGDTHAVVRVFYATDRQQGPAGSAKIFYGAQRGEVSHGQTFVSIPRNHRMGQLESAPVWKFWANGDPEKYVVLLSAGSLSRDAYLKAIQEQVRSARRRDLLVFVHGYNVTFEDAARRTAQMKYDLGFEGPAAFFSWPSQGQVAGYKADLETITASIPAIREFLTGLAQASGASTIYLVAHSMGNVGLLNALAGLGTTDRARLMPRVREIVLAAPDIDREVFVRDIAPRILTGRSRVTLYASASDRALQASEQLDGSRKVGDIRSGVVFARGLDTVDATGVDTSLVGHTYYAENRSIMSDMYYLIQQGVPPDQRFGLEQVQGPEGVYWRFKR